jgi:hypothetical protein
MLRKWRPFRRTLNVFVSYSHDDAHLVSPIVRLLTAMRNDVFVDSASIEVGADWALAIDGAIRKTDVVVVFWCQHSSQSTWVRSECDRARSLKKRLVPILLDDTALSPQLRDLHALDFRALGIHGTSLNSGPFNQDQAAALSAVILVGWLGSYGFQFARDLWTDVPQLARSALVFLLTFLAVVFWKRVFGTVSFLATAFARVFAPMNRRVALEVCERLDEIRAEPAPL